METAQKLKLNNTPFAKGYYNFYKLFWLFIFGSLTGNIYELLLHFIKTGELLQRKGVIYGPFNPVYGFAVLLIVLFLGSLKKNWQIFAIGSILGGLFEYICSLIQEKVFGTLSWDYSNLYFNINGRTTIQFALFWGLLSLLLIKVILPFISDLIERMPTKFGTIFTIIFAIFMLYNLFISSCAAIRDYERHKNIAPKNKFDIYLDSKYPEEVVRKVWNNATYIDKPMVDKENIKYKLF